MEHSKRFLLMAGASLLTSIGTLGSCSSSGSIKDYEADLEYKEDFKILWLTDIHYGPYEGACGSKEEKEIQFQHIRKMVELSDTPSLIVFSGDTFRMANETYVDEFIDFVDLLGFCWAFIFGNHDQEALTDGSYISNKVKAAKHSIFRNPSGDSITGSSNYYLNLNENGKTLYRILFLDSNSEGPNGGYDVIHEDQLSFVTKTGSLNDDKALKLGFIHIPFCEFKDAYDRYSKKLDVGTGSKNEEVCSPYINNGAYEVFKNAGFRAFFAGHDHKNDFSVDYHGEMILSYGLKSSNLDYFDPSFIGFKTIVLPKDSKEFGLGSIHEVFVPYE